MKGYTAFEWRLQQEARRERKLANRTASLMRAWSCVWVVVYAVLASVFLQDGSWWALFFVAMAGFLLYFLPERDQ